MKMLYKSILILLLTGIPLLLAAQDIMTAKDANALNKKGEIVLIAATPASDYAKVHAFGSVNIDPATLVDEKQMLKSPSELASILGNKGISSNRHLVIYDEGSMKGSGRLYWTFKYLGVDKVSVVDAGMKSWRINRLPVTKNPTIVKKATFTPSLKKQYLADFNMVNSALKSSTYAILDVRSPEEYTDPAGHIPGAVNIEFIQVLNTNGTLKSTDELKSLFTSNGITGNKKVIVYCRSSVRAGIVFLALHSALDYPNVSVYDGAFIEWAERAPDKLGSE